MLIAAYNITDLLSSRPEARSSQPSGQSPYDIQNAAVRLREGTAILEVAILRCSEWISDVDFDPALGRARRAHDPPVFGEDVRVPLRTELVQERRRPFDVAEEQGDGAGRQVP